MLNIC